MIGWNLNSRGETSNWSRTFYVDGMGWEGQGAGITAGQIDNNPRPDLVVMVYDNPSGANNFRYKIGWNLGIGGAVTSWSGVTQVAGVGWEGQGAGAALANLDGNTRPELLFMAYDAPAGANNFRVEVGRNLNTGGIATNWSNYISYPGVGWEGQGAGIRVLNLDANRQPDLMLMAYDNPAGANTFRILVGHDVDTSAVLVTQVGFPRDWNGDGSITSGVSANINGDMDASNNPILGVLTDWNDWASLVY